MVSTAISRPERDRAQRFVTVGLGVTVVVVAAGVFGQLIDYGLELHIAMLASGGGGGMLGAASDVAMAAAALAAWILLARLWPPSVATTALPVLLTVLAFTKGAPLALATFAVLVIVAQRLSERSRTLLQAALVLLAIAFLIHEGGNSALDVGPRSR